MTPEHWTRAVIALRSELNRQGVPDDGNRKLYVPPGQHLPFGNGERKFGFQLVLQQGPGIYQLEVPS